MRKVVDSNALRSPLLAAFLATSENNFAVLTDCCGIESHRESPLITVPQSMATLCQFPHQVIVLKSTLALCRLSGRKKGLQRRLIHADQTNSFTLYCRTLGAASSGSQGVQRQLLDKGTEAAKLIQEIEAWVPEFTKIISLLRVRYTSEARASIRQGDVLTREALDTLVKSAMDTAAILFSRTFRPNVPRSYDELLNQYAFRYALCGQLLALRWGAYGGIEDAKMERVRNDMIDLHFATSATYFDGFISNDQKSQGIYHQAREILQLMRKD